MKVTYTKSNGEVETHLINDNNIPSFIKELKFESLDQLKFEEDKETKDLVLKYPLDRKDELDKNSNLKFLNYSRIDRDPIYLVIGEDYPKDYISIVKPL